MISIESVKALTQKFFAENNETTYDFDLEQLQLRNEERRKKAIELLGDKWLLHPDNLVNKPERH